MEKLKLKEKQLYQIVTLYSNSLSYTLLYQLSSVNDFQNLLLEEEMASSTEFFHVEIGTLEES